MVILRANILRADRVNEGVFIQFDSEIEDVSTGVSRPSPIFRHTSCLASILECQLAAGVGAVGAVLRSQRLRNNNWDHSHCVLPAKWQLGMQVVLRSAIGCCTTSIIHTTLLNK